MRKKLFYLSIVMLLGISGVFVSCSDDDDNVDVSEIKVQSNSISIIEGESTTIKYTIVPENATDKALEWTSSNKAVATVDINGKIMAIAEGKANIIVKAINGVQSKIAVDVVKKEVPIEEITINPSELQLIEGGEQQIQVSILPANTTENVELILSSSDEDIASIDDYGVIHAYKSGTANIEVSIKRGIKGVCKVTVVEPSEYILSVPKIESIKKLGYVQKVMKKDEQVGQVCLEYIVSGDVKEQMLVVYPFKDNKVDLKNGLSLKDGGSVVWNLEENTCKYTPGSMTPTKIMFGDNNAIKLLDDDTPSSMFISLVTDIIVDKRSNDTQNYRIVKIGTQYWMAENLRAIHDVSGVEIPKLEDAESWVNDALGAYCFNQNDDSEKEPYGCMYNHLAIENYELAPTGYSVCSTDDWKKLCKYLDPKNYCDDPIGWETYSFGPVSPLLKSTTEWFVGKNMSNIDVNGNGNNLTGFNAFPGGERYGQGAGTSFRMRKFAHFWIKDKDSKNAAYFIRLFYDMDNVNYYFENVKNGKAVRCVKINN